MPWLALILAATPATEATAGASPPQLPLALKALQLSAARDWESLYLTFAPVTPASYGKADQLKISRALTTGCVALSVDDMVLACSMGEKALAFTATVEGALCAALAAKHLNQPAVAEALFRKGLTAAPKSGALWLELGRALSEEGDVEGALTALGQVPRKSPQHPQAQKLKARLEAQTEELTPLPTGVTTGHSFESSVDDEGRRVRANSHFRFRFFNGQRDFGQRAEYEGRVQSSLQSAQQASQRILGVSLVTPLEVVLYSRQEFALHHGPYAAAAVAGFYSGKAIRLNDSAEMNARTQTTLVHEYVHAVVDELTGFQAQRLPVWVNEGLAEWVEWQADGGDGAPVGDRAALRGLALRHSLPTLASMRQDPLISQRNPGVAYAFAAMAVRALAALTSVREVLTFIRAVGAGAPFEAAFESHFGRDLRRFEESLEADLAGR